MMTMCMLIALSVICVMQYECLGCFLFTVYDCFCMHIYISCVFQVLSSACNSYLGVFKCNYSTVRATDAMLRQ